MSDQKIYVGSGKTQSGKFGEFYKVSICLTDLPAEHITTAKNGKKYINLAINKKQAPDQYGKDLSVQVDTWKPEAKVEEVKSVSASNSFDDNLPF
jgi:hypothetical protein